MEFKLQISRTNLANSYYDVDLFPEQQLEYDLDFYDSVEIDKVKLPFYTKLRIPLTTNNKASNRFDFEPITSPAGDFPKDDFYFKITIYGNSSTEIAGILNVVSFEYNSAQSYIEVELKDYLSKYLAEVKDTKLGELYTDNYYTTRHTFQDFKKLVIFGGEAGIKGTNPDYTRPISFPYIDFCNDVDGKFGYGARQFLEYGTGIDRTGIMPVFSVKGFLQYLTAYISSAAFPLRVDSKLFELGDYASTPAFADFQAEKLHMVIPSQLLAKEDINRRNFFVRQSPAWSGTNQSLNSCIDLNGDEKLIHTQWFGNMETAGNYGTDGEGNPLYDTQDWGAEKRMGFYPADLDEDGDYFFDGIRGFFCPKVSFNADIRLNSGGTSVSIERPKLEIPVVGEDKLVEAIYTNTSTMRFKVYVGVYEDGFMAKKIPLQDSQGDDIILTMQNVYATQQGNSNKGSNADPYDYFQCEEGHEDHGVLFSNGAIWQDVIWFEDFTAYFPQDQEMFVNGGSRYGVNYFIEPLDGELDVRYATAYEHGGSHHTATQYAQGFFSVGQLRKLVTRISSYGELNVKFNSNADTLLYELTDEFVISDSINQTCPLNVSEILTALLKRFDCGLFYEFDVTTSEHILRIDPLSIVRTGSQNINSLIDDLKSVRISNGGDKVKLLEINNKDYGLYFDDLNNDGVTIGSTLQEINPEGIVEIKLDLNSSIYYRSVCGADASDMDGNQNFQNGAFSEKELGFTANIFTKNKDVGLRFAYLDKPLFASNLKKPFIKLKGNDQSGQMITETERIYIDVSTQHTFNGRLFPYNTAGWSLMFEDEDGNTTDTYDDIFATSEKIIQSENPRIEFDMVVPTSNLASLDFFLQTLTATRITPGGILVKSASGEVYDDYAYITIEGILQ
jgi:hypothetical protein